MKKIIFIALISVIGLIIASCDALIDPNGVKEPINKNIEPPLETKFPADSVYFLFKENYGMGEEFIWNYMIRLAKFNVLLDTSNGPPRLWFECEIENNTPDSYFLNRKDRVISCRIEIDSAEVFTDSLNSKYLELNGDRNSGKWASLTIKNLGQNNSNIFTGMDMNVIMVTNNDINNKMINGVFVYIINVKNYMFELKQFEIYFTIFYH